MNGQSYVNLWKQAAQADRNDLPQSKRKVLAQIAKRAEKEKAYGQLLKALLTDSKTAAILSEDSLAPAVERLKQREQETTDLALKAVYQVALSRIYAQSTQLDEDAQSLSKDYAAKAVSHPDVLAATKASLYEPFVIKGADSHLYGDDLLSLVCMETEQMDALHQYYLKTDNRPAQLLSALPSAQGHLSRIDSLISIYQDLPECGEAAIERYHALKQQENVTPRELVAYLDEALGRWGTWKRMNELRNERNGLTSIWFDGELPLRVIPPKQEQTLKLNELRGIRQLTMRIYRVKAEGDIQLNPNAEKDYKTLKPLLQPLAHLTQTKRFEPKPDYERFSDSLTLPGLVPGVYLIEMESQPKSAVSRELYFVSDVRVLRLPLPGNLLRFVVVRASSGQPIAGAQLRLKTGYGNNAAPSTIITCNGRGEYLYASKENPTEVFATAGSDRFCPPSNSYGYFSYRESPSNTEQGQTFTDRALYRPGQTVHACALLYQVKNGYEQQALKDKEVKALLRDANYQVVAEKTLRTDEYGMAQCDFLLPRKGLTGEYHVSFNNYRAYFNVEEYKRPTFEVELPKPEQDYKAGDTLFVGGTAKSYAGVPVQQAHVRYTVERRQAWWWLSYIRYWDAGFYGSSNHQEEIFEGETLTDETGHFEVRMPMVLPEGLGKHTMFYNFIVTAHVTDAAGETHRGELSLPLGNRQTALSLDMPSSILADNTLQPQATFHLRNAAGTDLSEEVSYRIDQGKWLQTHTNAPFSIFLSPLKSGKHLLEAVCMGDTLTHSFVVFGLDDKRPATETNDWFYVSASQFPSDGKPVTLQVGSSDKDVHIVYSIVSGNKVIENGSVKKSNELINRKFGYKEEYGNGLALCFAWVKSGHIYHHSTTILRPLPDKQLRLKWETFRDRLIPGQQEEWRLSVIQPDGKPAHAQMLATLYDKSLDQLREHDWRFTPVTFLPLPSLQWRYHGWGSLSLNGYREPNYLKVPTLKFNSFDHDCFPTRWMHRLTRGVLYAQSVNASSAKKMKVAEIAVGAQKEAIGAFDVAGQDEAAMVADEEADNEEKEPIVGTRQNLQETAFFYPQLTTDSMGIVTLKFTLPESLTTWRFMGLAHTADMMTGLLEGEAVATKTVMIQPNMPRFLRMGDKATITARIINTSEETLEGTVRTELIDPETEQVIASSREQVSLQPNGTQAVTFTCAPKDSWPSLLIARFTVNGETFSDGEQHYLAVMPNRERVTITVPFTQTKPGVKAIDLTKFSSHASHSANKLTFEYTNNPAWLMIQALPSIGHANDNCAICQATAYYANSIGQKILNQNPLAQHVFEAWKHENTQNPTLTSQLEKDEELKDLVLSETPWVMDAQRETEQKQQLSDFFDENLLSNRLNSAANQLKELQNADGSWSWWPGMKGSFFITVQVSEMLVRLNVQNSLLNAQLDNAFGYMDNEMVKLVAEMKRQEKKGIRQTFPSHQALQYLYLTTLDGRRHSAKVSEAQTYLKNLLRRDVKHQTLYEKALAAIILNSPLYIKSLKEYTVYKEDMGRYYDSPRAAYSWRDYRIPTQVAAIEALQRLTPNDSLTIDEMRRWLLQEKRAQAWDTPINSVNAVYAFLSDNSLALLPQEKSILKIDGKPIDTSEATAGIGYVKTAVEANGQQTFTVEKASTGTSWGAVYAQFMQDTKDIEEQAGELSVKREIQVKRTGNGQWAPSDGSCKLGDRVKVRIIIEAKRDLDFVEVIDRRAACMEPAQQLSGYHNGYYCAPKDHATHYFFDMLSKGKHVIETEYYIDRTGHYQTGTCTAQCAYAPDFRGTTRSQTFIVEE